MPVFYCPSCHSDKILGDKTGAPQLSAKGFFLNVGGSLAGLVLIAVAIAIDTTDAAWIGGIGFVLFLANVAMPLMVVFWRPVQTFHCLVCGFTVRGRSPARPIDRNRPGVIVPPDNPRSDSPPIS
jgi:hypothetical protein